jgi:hypothetical protein
VITTRFSDCCKDCVTPKRHLHCHADCPDYLAAKEEHIEEATGRRQKWLAEQEQIKKKRRKGNWQLGGGWRDDR